MRRWDVDRKHYNTNTNTNKNTKNKQNHKTFEDLIGLKREEEDGWQNLREKHSAHMNEYNKDKYKSHWQIQKVLIGWEGVDSWQKLGKSTLVAGKMGEGESVSVLLVKSQTGRQG